MVSFDIENLYPNVPIQETTKFLKQWLSENRVPKEKAEDYVKLTSLCMSQNVFTFRGNCYRFGTGTGNSLSPFLANLLLMMFERELSVNNLFPRIWCRYMDDVFAVVRNRSIGAKCTKC